jgi:hypothetical protein
MKEQMLCRDVLGTPALLGAHLSSPATPTCPRVWIGRSNELVRSALDPHRLTLQTLRSVAPHHIVLPDFQYAELFAMKMVLRRHVAGASFLGLLAVPLGAQQTGQQAPAPMPGPAVGTVAPDFEFTGISRYGILGAKEKLSDLRGSTVVLAFFPKARTKG